MNRSKLVTLVTAVTVAVTVLAGACAPAPPPPAPAPSGTSTPIMGPSKLTASQLTAWFDSRNITGVRSTVPVATLAALFVTEGGIEGVAGDLAFIQAIVETGWFRHSARVPPEYHNYSGIGAVDNGTGAASFPTPQVGVRAQIQHLRAYADPTTTCANFARPTVTPRCALVVPKGKARTWQVMGNGNWATDPAYAQKILDLYNEATAHARR